MLKDRFVDRERVVYLVLVILIGLGGLAAVIAATPRGVGTSPDAVNYIAASRTLLAGDGFERFNREPLERWPPLYPALLAVINVIGDALGVPLLESLRVLNGLTLAAIIITAGLLLERYLQSRLLALLGTLSILFSYTYLLITFFAYSDPLFVLLILLALPFLALFLKTSKPRGLVTAAGLVALACLQRYAGITMILTGGLCILLLMRGTPWIKRFQYGFVFGAISSTPLALWILNNYRVTGSFSSGHLGSEPRHTIRENISDIYDVMFRWFAPDRVEFGYLKAGAALLMLIGLFLVVVYWREHKLTPAGIMAALPFPDEALPVVIFVVTYLVFFILSSSSIIKIKTIDDRFLSPIYAPVMLIVFMLADRLAGWIRHFTAETQSSQKKRKILGNRLKTSPPAPLSMHGEGEKAPIEVPSPRVERGFRGEANFWLLRINVGTALVGIVLAAWLVYPAYRFVDQIRATSNADYNTGYDLPLIEDLRDHRPGGVVYSDDPLLTLIHAGLLADPVPDTVDGWAGALSPGKTVTLVWFGDTVRCDADARDRGYCVQTDYDVTDLPGVLVVEPLALFGESGVYRVAGRE
jgi:hypothetical protein